MENCYLFCIRLSFLCLFLTLNSQLSVAKRLKNNQSPVAGNGEITIVNHGSGNTVVLPANLFSNIQPSNDPDGSVNDIILDNFPANISKITVDGVAYTALPAGGLSIPADAKGRTTATVTFKLSFSGSGTVTFSFKAEDDEGLQSANTGTGIVHVEAPPVHLTCYNSVEGKGLSWSYSEGSVTDGNLVTSPLINQPGADGGFVFDLYSLDNSFNLEINGRKIALDEIQFAPGQTGYPVNVRFRDGDRYAHEVSKVKDLTGTTEHPILRVKINSHGEISFFGSKTSGGSLFPLVLYNGNNFNNVVWHEHSQNSVKVIQTAHGAPAIDWKSYGRNKTECRYEVAGNIYKDVNGLTDGRIDDNPNKLVDISDLYVIVSDQSVDTVSGLSSVNTPSGSYSIINLLNGNYELILIHEPLSGNIPKVGDAIPTLSSSLPYAWFHTGEFEGTGVGDDHHPDGRLKVIVNDADIPDANFGIRPEADLSITKDDGETDFTPGDTLIYTIIVENNGPAAVKGAAVKDTAPDQTDIVNWSTAVTGGATAVKKKGSGDLNAKVNIPVGGKVIFTVHLAVHSNFGLKKLSNTAVIAPPNTVADVVEHNNTATDVDNNKAEADLSISKDDGETTFSPGDTLTYTIIVKNENGPSDAFGALVSDNPPSKTDIVSWTAITKGGASVEYSSGIGKLSNESVDVPVGGEVIYSVKLAVQANFGTGDLINTAIVKEATDPDNNNNTAKDINQSVPRVDVSISKDDGQSYYSPGSTVPYKVVVKNAGPSDVSGATVVDKAPSGTTITGWSAVLYGGSTGSTSGSGDLNQKVDIPAGDSIVYTVNVSVPVSFTGVLENTATVDAVEDIDNTNNSATDIDKEMADLSVVKTDGQTEYIPGKDIVYKITVENSGPSDVKNLTVKDTAFQGTNIDSWTATFINASGAASGSGDLNESVNIKKGGQIVYEVTLKVPSNQTGTLINTAQLKLPNNIYDPDVSNNKAIDKDTRKEVADLSITKDDGESIFSPGDTLTYTIVVKNENGPSDAFDALITEIIPSNTSIVSWAAIMSGGASGANNGTGNLNEKVNVPVGGEITYKVKLFVHPNFGTGDLTNTVTVSGKTDPDLTNNTAEDTNKNNPKADLSITKTDGQSGYLPDHTTTYTIVVKNSGPSDVKDAAVKDINPVGTSIIKWKAALGGGAMGNLNGTGALNELVDIPVGDSIIYTVDLSIPDSFTGDLTNKAEVMPPAGVKDPDNSNNEAEDTNTEGLKADLSITKDDGETAYIPGGKLTYTVVVQNNGPDDALNSTVKDIAPIKTKIENWTAVTSNGASVLHTSGSEDIKEQVDLPVGGKITYSIILSVPNGFTGDLENKASVSTSSSVTEIDRSDNSASDIDYHIPKAVDDQIENYKPGEEVTLPYPITDNDEVFSNVPLDPATVDLDDSKGNCMNTTAKGCKEVNIPGQGTWSVDDDGKVTFSPEVGYRAIPDSIDYTVTDRNGNTSTPATIFIKFEYDEMHNLYIPNAFSPNGNGRSDIWKIYGHDIKEIYLLIYNQYGQKIVEEKSGNVSWDGTYKGKQQPTGVYVYYTKISFLDGSEITKKGSITLLR